MSRLLDLPKFLKPTNKMFLSVDLIGSTKLKHDENVLRKAGKNETFDSVGARWFNSLIDFYGGFEEKFTEAWTHAFSKDGIAEAHWPKNTIPSLWKINGDELIYVLDIVHPGQIVVALYAWREALISYRKHLQDVSSRLDVKATAWMAGFPVGNHEVAFWSDLSNANPGLPEHAGKFGQYYRLNRWYNDQQNGEKSEFVKDYIGPAVDTGFRISSFASSRRFPISIEIAYFLSKLSFDEAVRRKIALRYHGRESLKGVLGGTPYPIFWIDTASPDDKLTEAEDKLAPLQKPCEVLEVRDYVSLFFADEKNKLFIPFIFQCDDDSISEMPEEYEDLLCRTAEIWNAELKKHEIASSTDDPDDGVTVEPATSNQMETIIKAINTLMGKAE